MSTKAPRQRTEKRNEKEAQETRRAIATQPGIAVDRFAREIVRF